MGYWSVLACLQPGAATTGCRGRWHCATRDVVYACYYIVSSGCVTTLCARSAHALACCMHWMSVLMCCRTDVNKKRYDTVTFAIGGREFYALVRLSFRSTTHCTDVSRASELQSLSDAERKCKCKCAPTDCVSECGGGTLVSEQDRDACRAGC